MAQKKPVTPDAQGSPKPSLVGAISAERAITAKWAATLRTLPGEAASAFESCLDAISVIAQDSSVTMSIGGSEPSQETYVRRRIQGAALDLKELASNDRRTVAAAALGFLADMSSAGLWTEVRPECFARLPSLVTTMLIYAEWYANPAEALIGARARAISTAFGWTGGAGIEAFKQLESKVADFIGSAGGHSELNSLRSAMLIWRRVLENMDEEQRQRSVTALLAYLSELDDARTLRGLSPAVLATVVSLVGRALKLATANPDVLETPPLFADRKRLPEGRLPTAIEFFQENWAPLVATGRVFGDDLKDADLRLYQALSKHQSRNGASLGDLIPPSPTRGRLKHIRSDEERNAHLREAENKRARRYRTRKKIQPGG